MADKTKSAIDRPMPVESTERLTQLEHELAALRSRPPQTNVNGGLRMILIAGVIVAAIFNVGTVAVEYVKVWQMQQLAQIDQDAMRIMCAMDPPGEKEFNRTHLCEVVAREGRRPGDDEIAQVKE